MYKIIVLLSLFCFFTSAQSFACCSEGNHRLFPLGEYKKEVFFVEFGFSRRCEGDRMPGFGDKNEFWIRGIVNLVKYENDKKVIVENIDSFNLKECECKYENYYERTNYDKTLKKYYTKALTLMQGKDGFVLASPRQILFNDTTNISISDDETTLFYKNDEMEIDVESVFMVHCGVPSAIEERIYETPNYDITILRLSCYFSDRKLIADKLKRFEKIETAFWKERAKGHSASSDYLLIKTKNE